MSRLIIISNRLPVSVSKYSGSIRYRSSAGGLATSLMSLSGSYKYLWMGWPGITSEKLTVDDKKHIEKQLTEDNCYPVFLPKKLFESYYHGFSNKTIWPLFHYFPLHVVYEPRFWQSYVHVNQVFCEHLTQIAKPTDLIWVHDYHLMLLPEMIRKKMPDAQIAFFLHIPFPSFELFRVLPWRKELLEGLLGADLIGFHTYDYARHLLSSVRRIMGIEQNLGKLSLENRIVQVDAFPMGIDYKKYSEAPAGTAVKQEIKKIRQKTGGRKIILSIDRLDYTKGIIQRLEAFDLFLSQNPKYKGQVTMIMVAVPSRTNVEDYKQLRDRLEQLIGRVNGEHGAIGQMPVWYFYREVPFERLIALYNIADIALITPLRDGMNLIAKEYIATKTDGKGVLILSEMAGAASELGEALVVNANNKQAIVDAIGQAVEMPVTEQIERNRAMQSRLSRYNFSRWVGDFLNALSDIKNTQQQLSGRQLTESVAKKIITEFGKSKKRLLLLDYDGTLVGFKDVPEKAGPDEEIKDLLRRLAEDPKNTVTIISGRDKSTMDKWLGDLETDMVAEHGAWFKQKNHNWQCIEQLQGHWKETIKPILELYADRTPGSLVEEKDFSLVWHYRRANPELAYIRALELRDALSNLTANLGVGVFEGNKILEVKSHNINKGEAANLWLRGKKWDFILAAGDDYTDEEMFAILPKKAYSVKVGTSASEARFNVDSINVIRTLLKGFVEDVKS